MKTEATLRRELLRFLNHVSEEIKGILTENPELAEETAEWAAKYLLGAAVRKELPEVWKPKPVKKEPDFDHLLILLLDRSASMLNLWDYASELNYDTHAKGEILESGVGQFIRETSLAALNSSHEDHIKITQMTAVLFARTATTGLYTSKGALQEIDWYYKFKLNPVAEGREFSSAFGETYQIAGKFLERNPEGIVTVCLVSDATKIPKNDRYEYSLQKIHQDKRIRLFTSFLGQNEDQDMYAVASLANDVVPGKACCLHSNDLAEFFRDACNISAKKWRTAKQDSSSKER